MATDFKSIPMIDIGPLLAKCDDPKMGQDSGVAHVVKQLDQACKEAGFFYVKGHGIPETLMKEVKNLTHRFFELPYEEKTKIKMTVNKGYRGYQIIGDNRTKGVPDIHEAIDCYKEVKPGMYGDLGKPMEGCNQWPTDPPNYKPLMEEYISLCTVLSKNIMRGISLALCGSPYEFEGERAGDAFWLLRNIGYPGSSNSIGLAPHTDYGLLILVNQDDDINALQVRNRSAEWISATPVPGTFVCNIGDMLQIYSNGLYESTVHQVINSSPKFRVSLAFFYETNFDTAVEPLDICKQKTGGAKKFERAVYGKHLFSKLQENFPFLD